MPNGCARRPMSRSGGISTGLVVVIYNISAAFFGGIQVELQAQQPPRKPKGQVDIE